MVIGDQKDNKMEKEAKYTTTKAPPAKVKTNKDVMPKKIINTAKSNLNRQILTYLFVLPLLCSLFLVPALQVVLLYTAAVIGVLVLWFVLGWFFVRHALPSGRLSSEGKAVFVTGCDTGFGHKLALQLDREGYQVFAGCLFPDGDGAHALRNTASNRLHVVGIDVTKEEDFERARDHVRQNLNGNVLWAVIANAGILELKEFEWFSSAEIARTLDVNVLGVSRTALTFLPLLRESRGRLLIVSSYAGRMTPSWHSVYSMSKHATIALADGLRKEFYKFDVSVVTIEPFYYRTPMLPTFDMAYERFHRQQKADVKALYTDDYLRTETESHIAFMDILARENADEVVDVMANAIAALYPQNNYRIVGFANWFLCQTLLLTPAAIFDWADQLAHCRWTRGANCTLVRRKSAYERLFGVLRVQRR